MKMESKKKWINPSIVTIGVESTEATSDFKCRFGCIDKHGRPKGYNSQAKLEKHYAEKHAGLMVPPVCAS